MATREDIAAIARATMLATSDALDVPPEHLDEAVRELASHIQEGYGSPKMPKRGESVSVCLQSQKTAALFFDKVWQLPMVKDGAPKELIVYGATYGEILISSIILFKERLDVNKTVTLDSYIEIITDHKAVPHFGSSKSNLQAISNYIGSELSINSTPMYEVWDELQGDLASGTMSVLVAAIEGLELVDESRLSWEQVLEVRRDKKSKNDLRRLKRWFSQQTPGASVEQIQDEVALKLDDYQNALQKHGVQTILGSLSDLLDPRFMAGASALTGALALGGGVGWGAIGAGGLAIGRTTLSIAQRSYDLGETRRANGEVAFLHSLKRMGAS